MTRQLARADCVLRSQIRGEFRYNSDTLHANTTGLFWSTTEPSHDQAFAARPAVNHCRLCSI